MSDSSLSILIEAIDNASGRIDKIENSLNRLNKTAEKANLSDQFKQTGKKIQDVGKTMTTHMTLPIVAGLGYATKAAIDFESSLSDVNKVTGMTAGTEEARAFGDEILKLSRTVPLAATELASIAAAGGGLVLVGQLDAVRRGPDHAASVAARQPAPDGAGDGDAGAAGLNNAAKHTAATTTLPNTTARSSRAASVFATISGPMPEASPIVIANGAATVAS
jgi:hypothetical protein